MKSIGPIHHLPGIIRTPNFLDRNVTRCFMPAMEHYSALVERDFPVRWVQRYTSSKSSSYPFKSPLIVQAEAEFLEIGPVILTLCITEYGQACRICAFVRFEGFLSKLLTSMYVMIADDEYVKLQVAVRLRL